MSHNKVPLFTAITFPAEINGSLMRIINHLGDYVECAECRTEPESRLHLTLRYQPAVHPAGPLIERLAQIQIEPFELSFGKLGLFESEDGQVIWIGVEGGRGALLHLKERMDREFEALGYPAMYRVYRPHITLAYARNAAIPRGDAPLFPAGVSTKFHVDSFHLFREIKQDVGIRFDAVQTFSLRP